MRKYLLFLLLYSVSSHVFAQPDTLGWRLEHYSYPYPVKYMTTILESQKVEIAYMDVKPQKWNGKTLLLMHGKNFPAAYWKSTIKEFSGRGYRVVAPDALGFGKSSKPIVHYTFSLLALLEKQLLDSLGIGQVAIVAHSTGGMLATRFTLEYPRKVTKLVLADAIGLEDWRAMGAPYRKVDVWYNEERNISYDQVLNTHKQYYAKWNEAYRHWADVQYGMAKSSHADQYAIVSALTYDMIFTEPVLYEFPSITVPVLVVVGMEDKTKIARDATAEKAALMGNYRELGKRTAAAIPGARLAEYESCGHLPFFERESEFFQDVTFFLEK